MAFKLVVSAAAAEDMEKVAIWYEDQRSGLGGNFLLETKKGFARIQSSPERYPIADSQKDWRFHLLPAPFRNYKIIYPLQEDKIVVLAVFHVGRDPNIWKSRA
ncbi:MAG: type II toxin-antitoxin system RelE/ParE family toxin [Bacteroidota bacterium]